MGVVLCQAWSESQWTVLTGYLTIPTNVRRHQPYYRWQFLFQEDSIVRTTQSNCCSTLDWYSIWEKNVIFVFSRSARYRSAETQVIWGGIAKHLLIAYFIGNISTKNCQNPFMCVKVRAILRWDVFETRCNFGYSAKKNINRSCTLIVFPNPSLNDTNNYRYTWN